ncbi:hypothetical protein E2C01_044095 [Portunus trituberculatus]|uniref:Uncharacterized protein n=1 Tax=Portunus trituberculatus TaxID=210409 RepID=A0A5B7FUN7_PORTR|nr:hypothetical protein [Portunus trituberculatus]
MLRDPLVTPPVRVGICFSELYGNACLSSPFLLPEPLKLPLLGRLHSSPAHRPAYSLVPQRADTNEQDSSRSSRGSKNHYASVVHFPLASLSSFPSSSPSLSLLITHDLLRAVLSLSSHSLTCLSLLTTARLPPFLSDYCDCPPSCLYCIIGILVDHFVK